MPFGGQKSQSKPQAHKSAGHSKKQKGASRAAKGKDDVRTQRDKKFARPKLDYSSGQFEEIESYPIHEPFAYVRILYNRKAYTRLYHVVEPEITKQEAETIQLLESILIRGLSVRVEDLDEDPVMFLRKAVREAIIGYNMPVNRRSEEKIFYYIKRDLLGYGLIDVLMNDPNIEDISCDGPGIPIYIYDRRYESMETTVYWDDEDELDNFIIRLAQRCDKHISIAEPLLDATLMDGSRVVMTLGREVSTRGSTFTIRKFREEPFTPPDLIDFNTMSSLIVAYLWIAIQHGMCMLVVGGTASGKTTTLNALALFIQPEMKVVSIEETRELNLPHPNWIPGVTREGFGGEAVAPGEKRAGEVNMYDLLRAALRERPEYIIVGEIRGSEAYVLFQAMSTGHTTYSTIHADSVPSLVHRLENKPIDIPRVMIPALDAVCIQIQTRIGERRVRRMKQVVEIIGLDPHTGELLTNEVFRWIPATDEYEFSGKSYVLEKIMVKTNMSKQQIMEELRNRKDILEWMVENDIRTHQDVSNIIQQYYVRPEYVIKKIGGGTQEAITAAGPQAEFGFQAPPQAPQETPQGPPPMPMPSQSPYMATPSPAPAPSYAPSPAAQPPPTSMTTVAPSAPAGAPGGAGGFPCPSCGTPVDVNAKQCPSCGEQFDEGLECPTCGAPVAADSTFCGSCGERFG